MPKLLPLIFSPKKQQGFYNSLHLFRTLIIPCYCLSNIIEKWPLFRVYGTHSENLGTGINCSQLAEPSRSVTTPARVSNRGLCLSCCSLAYGEVQTTALPARLAAFKPTSQDRRRESSHCCQGEKQRKAGLRSSLVARPQPCRTREGDRGTCMKKIGGTERNGGKKERGS